MSLQPETLTPPNQPDGALPWLASYPPGVPERIDADSFPSLHAMLLDACRSHAERASVCTCAPASLM